MYVFTDFLDFLDAKRMNIHMYAQLRYRNYVMKYNEKYFRKLLKARIRVGYRFGGGVDG